jgi:DNA-binding HxlR family transcriptional regulator
MWYAGRETSLRCEGRTVTATSAGMRSYGDPCGLARALDLVGERWSLLVLRELLFGPKRFTDLRAGMPGASPNVLAQRLRELEQAGIVRRRKLAPPSGVAVYELTERGYALEPAIVQLARWGSDTPPMRDAELGVDALMLALKTTFDPKRAGGLRATFALRFGDEQFHLTIEDGRIDVARGEPRHADAAIDTSAATLRAVVFGGHKIADARRSGALTLEGDKTLATRLLRLFPLASV